MAIIFSQPIGTVVDTDIVDATADKLVRINNFPRYIDTLTATEVKRKHYTSIR
jgi:3-methyladenine DNA glycosylase AlkD